MDNFCFSAYIKAIQNGFVTNNSNLTVVSLILNSVNTSSAGFVNIDSRMASNLMNRKDDAHPNLRAAAGRHEVMELAVRYFKEKVVPEINPHIIDDICLNLMNILKDDASVPASKLSSLEGWYNSGDAATFLAQVALYAISRDNKAAANDKVIEITGNSAVPEPAPTLKFTGDNALYTTISERNAFSLDTLFRMPKRSIFVSGMSMVSITRAFDLVIELLENGVEMRLLMWDILNEPQYSELLKTTFHSREMIETEIRSTLDFIVPIYDKYGNLQIAFTGAVSLMDYVGVDVEDNNGFIKVQAKLYKEHPARFPNFCITRADSHIWYDRFKTQIDKVWNDSRKASFEDLKLIHKQLWER